MDVVVLASGRGSNLGAILRAIDEGRCAARVAAVVSDKADALALELARSRQIPTAVLPFVKGDDRAAWDARLAETVASFAPKVVVLAGFMRIVGPAMLARFSGRIVNVHPALLPCFPGTDGPAQAIRARVRVSGCTVHVVDAGVDTGPILTQAAVPVLADDDADRLHLRIQKAEHRLLPATLDAIARGAIDLGPPPRIVSVAASDDRMLVSPAFGEPPS